MTYKRRTTVSHYLIVSDIWLVKRDVTGLIRGGLQYLTISLYLTFGIGI